MDQFVTEAKNIIDYIARALRTALNYFLAKDIEKEASADQRRAQRAVTSASVTTLVP